MKEDKYRKDMIANSSENIIKSNEDYDDELSNWTNNVLFHQHTATREHIFVPCYMRMKCKNIVSMDLATMSGSLNAVIIFSVYYGTLDETHPEVFEYLSKMIILRFKMDPPIVLEEGIRSFKNYHGDDCKFYITRKINKKERLITFSVRRLLAVHLDASVFWSPFQLVDYITTVIIGKMRVSGRDEIIHFNLMDNPGHRYSVASYTDEGALGEYDLAENLISAQFSNLSFHSGESSVKSQIFHKNYAKYREEKMFEKEERESLRKILDDSKIEAFHYAHFVYPMYRQPLVPLLTLFFPIVMLSFINLGIFFQDEASGKRILNIGALMVSYIALLPSIRNKLPPSDSLVFAEILTFVLASMTIMSLAHSLRVRNIEKFDLEWEQSPLFIVTLAITLLVVSILVFVSLFYFLYWFRHLNKDHLEGDERKFDRTQWSNQICDKYFRNLQRKGYEIGAKSLMAKGKKRDGDSGWKDSTFRGMFK